jgi:hypothetical protein
MKRTSRKPSKLSSSLQGHLNAYALAASAAGVGMLALARPAEAKIIYTPAHHHVLLNNWLGLDLNHDGIVDFAIRRTTYYDLDRANATWVYVKGARRNRVAGIGRTCATTYATSYCATAYALRTGRKIDRKLTFPAQSVRGYMANRWGFPAGTYICGGQWNNVTNRYLGFKFQIKGQIHYGWARLSESCNKSGPIGTGARALLTGYAYETIPNKPIIAGKTKGPDVITLEPSSLGALAAGRK